MTAPRGLFVFGAMGGDKTLAIFDRGSHNVFTDRRHFDSAGVANSVKGSTQRLTLAFLQSLDDRPGESFAELSAVKEPGPVTQSTTAGGGAHAPFHAAADAAK